MEAVHVVSDNEAGKEKGRVSGKQLGKLRFVDPDMSGIGKAANGFGTIRGLHRGRSVGSI
jgi:hypothetical protein